MKLFFAVILFALAAPVTAQAQGYAGVIAADSQTQQNGNMPDNKAGYAGVMVWDDTTGGTAYDPENANIYNFVGSSGGPKSGEERRFQAKLKASEDIKARAAASRAAVAEARKKKYAEQQAAVDQQIKENQKRSEELNRQVQEQNRPQQSRQGY